MNNYISKKCRIPPYDRSADGELKLASFCSSGLSCRPQKMLKHLLLYSIMKDFIGALGVLNFSKDTLRVLMIAVALGRFGFVHQEGNLRPTGSVEVPHALTACIICPPQ